MNIKSTFFLVNIDFYNLSNENKKVLKEILDLGHDRITL